MAYALLFFPALCRGNPYMVALADEQPCPAIFVSNAQFVKEGERITLVHALVTERIPPFELFPCRKGGKRDIVFTEDGDYGGSGNHRSAKKQLYYLHSRCIEEIGLPGE